MAEQSLQAARQRILDLSEQALREDALRSSQVQQRFLDSRQEALQQLAGLFQAQAAAAGADVELAAGGSNTAPLVFTRRQLEEFAVGDVTACLGQDYAIYAGRRLPRIPNGDLLLMDRVTRYTGRRMNFEPGTEIEVEYDVPRNAWYLQGNSFPDLPYAVLMEIALQPCGMISAHLGSSLLFPDQEYYFRNLDGEARLHERFDLRGKTIVTVARLIRHTVSASLIIQAFEFQLSCEGRPIYSGSSVFGSFPPEAMANQLGLDGRKEILPLFLQPGQGGLSGRLVRLTESPYYQAEIGKPFYRLPDQKLKLLSEAFVAPQGGRAGLGYVFARKPIDPADWFFTNHFFEDPVMPGSLGVEAILEAIQLLALDQDLGRELVSPRFDLVSDQVMEWKYRGQILRSTGTMNLEVHLTGIEKSPGQVLLTADASLWADRTRIYEIKGAALRLVEG